MAPSIVLKCCLVITSTRKLWCASQRKYTSYSTIAGEFNVNESIVFIKYYPVYLKDIPWTFLPLCATATLGQAPVMSCLSFCKNFLSWASYAYLGLPPNLSPTAGRVTFENSDLVISHPTQSFLLPIKKKKKSKSFPGLRGPSKVAVFLSSSLLPLISSSPPRHRHHLSTPTSPSVTQSN